MPNRPRESGSSSSVLTCVDRSVASLGSDNSPVRPWRTNSGMRPMREATTGFAWAIASRTEIGAFSCHSELHDVDFARPQNLNLVEHDGLRATLAEEEFVREENFHPSSLTRHVTHVTGTFALGAADAEKSCRSSGSARSSAFAGDSSVFDRSHMRTHSTISRRLHARLSELRTWTATFEAYDRGAQGY
jgi:hypothetical protein